MKPRLLSPHQCFKLTHEIPRIQVRLRNLFQQRGGRQRRGREAEEGLQAHSPRGRHPPPPPLDVCDGGGGGSGRCEAANSLIAIFIHVLLETLTEKRRFSLIRCHFLVVPGCTVCDAPILRLLPAPGEVKERQGCRALGCDVQDPGRQELLLGLALCPGPRLARLFHRLWPVSSGTVETEVETDSTVCKKKAYFALVKAFAIAVHCVVAKVGVVVDWLSC